MVISKLWTNFALNHDQILRSEIPSSSSSSGACPSSLPEREAEEEQFVQVEEHQGQGGDDEADPAEHVHGGGHKARELLDQAGTRR